MSSPFRAISVLLALVAGIGCATGPSIGSATPPVIATVATDPTPPVAPRIRWTINGSNFNPDTIRVFFNGPGCPDGCEVPTGAIDRRTETQISGLADLAVGTYELTARNGNTRPSNGLSIRLIGR